MAQKCRFLAATYRAFKRWQGDRSQSEIAAIPTLESSATTVTNEDIAEVLKQVHGSAGVSAADWQRYTGWAAGNSGD